MTKAHLFPRLNPQSPEQSLRGLTLYELFHRQERNDNNIKLLSGWLDEIWDINTYNTLIELQQFRQKLVWAIRLKRLKMWLFSLVGRN